MKFRDRIASVDPGISPVPAGYNRYGHVMVLRNSEDLPRSLGRAALATHDWCRSVYQHLTTTGESRLPQLRLLAGDDDPQVVHTENGVRYDVDLARITFSGGNRRLRERLVDAVSPGEFLVDMFAAVGNLSLQPLVHRDIEAILVEKNPYTYSRLLSSLELNGLPESVAVNADCRDLEVTSVADRIFMGYHGVGLTHLQAALRIARSSCVLHLHPILPVDSPGQEASGLLSLIGQAGGTVASSELHHVKGYAPGLAHYELVAAVSS